jgi:hypothetical protein
MSHEHHHISAGEALGVFALLSIEKSLREKNRPAKNPTPYELGLGPRFDKVQQAKFDAEMARLATVQERKAARAARHNRWLESSAGRFARLVFFSFLATAFVLAVAQKLAPVIG